MAKEDRSKGSSVKTAKDPAGKEAKAHSRQAGDGSEERGVYINERGEVCYGNECVTLAIDTDRGEIRVNIKQNPACNIDALVEGLRDTMAKGAKTVYEVESEIKDKES